MNLKFTALLLVCGAVNNAGAAVSPATVNSSLNLANLVGPPQRSTQTTFGTHQLTGAGTAMTTIGGDAAGTPFIQYAATTPDTAGSTPNLSGSLRYSWEIVSADGAQTPVLVHISTAGWVNARYGFGPYRAGLNLPGDANSLDVLVATRFQTQTNTGIDQRIYGLQSGGVNWGATSLAPEFHFTPQFGGYSQVAGSFNTSFDLWVIPNTRFGNSISLDVYTAFRQNSPAINDYALEWYDSSGFIDPVITVDAAYTGRFSVAQSDIPMTPVPEASALAMMLGGLGLLGVFGARRRAH